MPDWKARAYRTVLEMLGGVASVAGRIEVGGRPVTFGHPSQAIAEGVVYMPPDRKKGGLWLEQDASFNIGSALCGAHAAGVVAHGDARPCCREALG